MCSLSEKRSVLAVLPAAILLACGTPERSPREAAAPPPVDTSLARRAAMLGPSRVAAIPAGPVRATWQSEHVLRVCADPNNLPFSNRAGKGFENRIAALIARDIGARVVYTWWPQRRGFARMTLNSGACDVIMGVPVGYDFAATTAPYYASTYVFLTRHSRNLRISSLDDPVLRRLRIGLHTIGDDYANTPAAQALARRGIVRQVVGYSIYGDYSRPDPPAELVRAVERGDVDVAIVWGPLAGYFASRSPEPLDIRPVTPRVEPPATRFVFAIAAGARRSDSATLGMLDREITRRAPEIRRILNEYDVPLVEPERAVTGRGGGS